MIQYRFLTSDDVTLYKKTVMTFRQQEVSDEKALKVINDPNVIIQVAYQNEDVCGYTLSYRMPRMDNGNDMLMVYHCFVAPEYQRRHVATTMMQNMLDYANKEGIHYMMLTTQTDNDAANALYDKLGGYLHPTNRNIYYWYITGQPKI